MYEAARADTAFEYLLRDIIIAYIKYDNIIHHTLYIIHSIFHIPYSIFYSLYSILYILYIL